MAPAAPDDGIVFATLHLPEGGVGTAAELAKLLAPHIELPDIRETLQEDHMLNRRNAEYHWNHEDTQELPSGMKLSGTSPVSSVLK